MSEMDGMGNSGNNNAINAAGEPFVKENKTATPQQERQQEEDVIPTAIVIKNIPFAIKKEQLLDVIGKMDLPLPYAFNYHFDNGVFRGLAFANFTNTDETTQVLTSLNGKEIGGRKLRVEYKKMLPQAERERIEREKREKRGQLEEQHKSLSNLSLHTLGQKTNHIVPGFINENSMNNAPPTTSGGTPLTNNQVILSAQSTPNSFYQQPGVGGGIPNRERPIQIPPPASQQQPSQHQQQRHPFMHSTPNALGGTPVNGLERYYAPLPSSSTLPLPPQQLDFNDPDTLEIYSQLLLFKDRERFYYELAYPVGLSATHKRIINVLCSFLGLIEIYDPTFIIIRKKILDRATLQSHLQQQGQGQVTMSHPLQPSSTGGSMNRSQSYTSLLQAHAAASVAAAAGASNNSGNNTSGALVGTAPGTSGSITALPSGSVTTTPKLRSHPPISSLSSNNQAGNPSSTPSTVAAAPAQGSTSSPSQLLQPIALHHSEPQVQSTPQQQQQSFLRQQAALTPSSRIPSGYASNHGQLNTSVNPLLRNSNGISPSSANVQPHTAQHRIPQPFYGPSTLQMGENGPTTSSGGQLMGPQHTNGSLHSNFSTQSLSENPIGGTTVTAPDFNLNSNLNGGELIYTSWDTTGLGNGLEEGLNRSLSGLDLQSNGASGLGACGASTARRSIW